MKNKIMALFLSVSVGTSLVACGNSEKTDTSVVESSVSIVSQQEVKEATSATKTQYPLTIDVYDVDGEMITQTFTQAPTRAIPYTASAVNTMLELGLEDKIVGIMKPDNTPPEEFTEVYEGLNIIGDKTTVSKEAIIALEPDILFGRAMTLTDDSMGTVGDFNQMEINVYPQKSSNFIIDQSLEFVFEDIRNIGEIFDVQDRAEAYILTLQDRLEVVRENVSVDKTEEPLKAILLARYDDGNCSAFGNNSKFHNAALKELNMVNVVDGLAAQMTVENLVALNPDVIIYVTADRNSELDKIAKEKIFSNAALSDIPAIKNNKYVEVSYETMMDYGPSTFDAIEIIYDGIYKNS